MKDYKIPPDRHTYHALVVGLLRHKKLKEARETLNMMRFEGVVPGTVFYGLVMQHFARGNRFDVVKELFKDASLNQVDVDEITFCSLITECIKYKETSYARLLATLAKLRGLNITEDLKNRLRAVP